MDRHSDFNFIKDNVKTKLKRCHHRTLSYAQSLYNLSFSVVSPSLRLDAMWRKMRLIAVARLAGTWTHSPSPPFNIISALM